MFINRSVLLVLLVSWVFVSVVSASDIIVLAPIDGESVKSSDVLIIAKTSKDVKEVELTGIAGDSLKVKVTNGGFSAKVKLPSDDNNVTITADDGSKTQINIKVNASGSFTYHPDESEVSDCKICHGPPEIDGYAIPQQAAVCYECHDANNDKAYVHGPVNMGICVVCHMPHGSINESYLLAKPETLCNGCHDSLMSTHPDRNNKSCVECHDPHSTDSEFHIK